MIREKLIEQIFNLTDPEGFRDLVMNVFYYQAKHCSIYQNYLKALKVAPNRIKKIEEIPFLPISLFKQFDITTSQTSRMQVFTSSGTTGMKTSRHIVGDITVYERSFQQTFEQFYGSAENWCILALLPAYLERTGSSLVYMADKLIKKSAHPLSGFFLHQYDEVAQRLQVLEKKKQPTLLLGVTFALLDLAEAFPMPLRTVTIMETGGMKGRRTEIIREEVHHTLKNAWGVKKIHSEYGMTELLSQAYSSGDGLFYGPPWMKILIRDATDPLSWISGYGKNGGICVIDLANIDSCAFIATEDLGKIYPDGSFEILGRFDQADVRGCNLLAW